MKAVNPSIRECFAGLCTLAAIDGKFEEYDFIPALLRAPSLPSFQASTRESRYRHFTSTLAQQAAARSTTVTQQNGTMVQLGEDQVNDIANLGIQYNAIIFGYNNVGHSHVKTIRHLNGSPLSKVV